MTSERIANRSLFYEINVPAEYDFEFIDHSNQIERSHPAFSSKLTNTSTSLSGRNRREARNRTGRIPDPPFPQKTFILSIGISIFTVSVSWYRFQPAFGRQPAMAVCGRQKIISRKNLL
jgi:hypothetical protein